MTPKQFHPLFAEGRHIWLEKCDAEEKFAEIELWLSQPGQLEIRKAFMKFWIKKTESIFGKWNWTKRQEADLD
jgi:hypothetical protein